MTGRKLSVATALLGAMLLAGCDKAPTQAPTTSPPAAVATEPGVIRFPAGSPDLDAIEIVAARSGPLPVSADLNARIAVNEDLTARVGAPVAGRVTRVLVDIGGPVRAGQALARMDAPDLAQATADKLEAESDADLKRRAADRARTLFEGDALARRDLEAANAEARSADAELTRARLRLRNLGGGAGTDLSLTSPVAGYVLDRQIEAGQQLTPGQSPLFTVTDPRRLWLLVDVPETAIARARVGEAILFEVNAFPGRRFAGKITRIGLAVDPATRRIQVRAEVPNPDLALKPEMFARARFVTDDGETAIRVPNAALFEQGLKSYVFRVDAPGTFRRLPVTVGVRGEDASYVTAGLKDGDKIVGEGALLLNAQMAGEQ
ncbi:efflux RND transporter periplasmic adaptor subunit [Polymorphobacter fuscus]|uniref:Efflux RND transporter periplasmic adaptor subunit n=1 Tax=Sandarakinorhabdus fusca TaxID=1439888 RepID=A0A7C9GT38_9SPHN|nr:efflux RND transporter periplasmic adaptor subunit [Polymorphobacter fuscus]KAB7648678.1 efflux RND transporter periplasmic adaptor subunit [Polymorphobacter fuscus]MQT16238.1 efflux RND transporter periplasmic adaptor subunit [Polymorphobacter fuscus]NJC07477.1 cobalt-zinc-cadmium efflux system membrane fusion protein [Polymorphobacter fuscus]